ncbi:MAG: zinc ribbon domain-containing protein [Sphingomonas sp.]
MSAPQHDFYTLLSLGPDVDDWPVIEKTIAEHKTRWTRALGSRSAVAAKQNLALVPRMQADLKDPALRAEYRRFAIEQAERRRKTAEALLADLFETLDGQGPLGEEDIENIARALGPDIGKPAIAHAAAGKGFEFAVASPARKAGRTLLGAVASRIEKLLEAVDRADLYAFLGMERNATPAALAEKAKSLRQGIDEIKRDSDAYNNTNDLIGVCLTQFKDLTAKQVYDDHLADRGLKPLDAHIRLLGDRGPIDAEGFAALVRRGILLGATPAAAETYIDRAIEKSDKYRRAIAKPAGGSRRKTIFCGSCGTVAASPESTACTKCGRKLKQDCPSCQLPVYSMHAFCDRCGFDTGDCKAVDAQIASATAAMAAQDLEKAETLLRAVIERWPGHRQVTRMMKDVVALRADAIKAEVELDGLIRTRKLGQAEKLLVRAVQEFGAGRFTTRQQQLELLRAKAALPIAEAQDAVRRKDHAAAGDLLEQALRIEADNEEAAAMLASLPVDPPEDVRLSQRGNVIELEWTAQPGIAYRIMRRSRSSSDIIADEIEESQWIDRAPPTGTALVYEIRAQRSGRLSPAVAPAPVLLAVPATNFRAVAGDGRVDLGWTRPAGAVAVDLIIASAGARTGRHRMNGDSFLHDSLPNGTTFHYSIVACFPDPSGGREEVESELVFAKATPSPILAAIAELKATRSGSYIDLSWPPPKRGHAEIRVSGTTIPFAPGTRISPGDLGRVGHAVPISDPSTGHTQVELTACSKVLNSAVARFVAIAVEGDSVTVGAAAQVVIVDPATNFTSRADSQKISLQWTWPETGNLAMIAARLDGPPAGPRDPAAVRFEATRSAYRADGHFDIRRLGDKPHHIGLWIGQEGVAEHSEPVRLKENLGVFTTVRYRVATSPFGKRRSIVCTGPAGIILNDVRVHGMPGYPPATPEAGVEIVRLASLVLKDGKADIPVPPEFAESGMFIKMFCKDNGDISLETSGGQATQL